MNLLNIALANETTAENIANTEEGLLASLGINGTLFIFQLINFAVVALILWFLILKPLTKKMSERQKLIDKSIEQTKEIEKNLSQSAEQYQVKMTEAKKEANKIIAAAQQEAIKATNVVKDKAQQDIERIKEQAKNQINKEKDIARQQVRDEAASMITAAAEKIITAKIDEHQDNQLIKQIIGDLKIKS